MWKQIQGSQGLASGIYDPGPETTRTAKLNERRACRYHPGKGVRYRDCRYTKITHDDGQWRGRADRSDLALTLILWDKESCTTSESQEERRRGRRRYRRSKESIGKSKKTDGVVVAP